MEEWLDSLANIEGTFAGSVKLARFVRFLSRTMLGMSPSKVEILRGREDLDRKYPVNRFLKRGNEVYLAWLSGQGVLTRHKEFLESECIKTLLLPNPKSDYVLFLKDSFGVRAGAYDFPSQIAAMTNIAKASKVPVRWVKSYIGTNLTIVNPTRNDGFVHIEPCLPGVEPNDRRSFRLEKTRNEAEVASIYETFKELCKDKNSAPQ